MVAPVAVREFRGRELLHDVARLEVEDPDEGFVGEAGEFVPRGRGVVDGVAVREGVGWLVGVGGWGAKGAGEGVVEGSVGGLGLVFFDWLDGLRVRVVGMGMGWVTYSGEFRSMPSCVRSWPIANAAVSASGLRTFARRPASPYLSIGVISSMGTFSAVWAAPPEARDPRCWRDGGC